MKKKIIIQRVIFTTLLILNFTIIFMFSSENGDKSSGTSRKLVVEISKILNIEESNREEFVNELIPYARKLAHFSIYMLAGVWEILLFNTYNMKDEKKIIICTLIGMLYAISDEIHQGFSPGRTPKAMDVLIDTEGNLVGILFTLQFVILNRKKK